MRKLRNYAMLGLMGLMGTLGIGVTSADDVWIFYHPEANVSYTLNSGFDTSGEFTAGLISITNGDETYTIMDRNLGATAAGTGCENPNWGDACAGGDPTYGYYFQWGNNYGFPSDPNASITTSSEQVDVSGYGPGNYYSSSTFITVSWDDRSSVQNDNLRGGVSGTYEAMQGPCPEGYHVPSSGEWLGLLTMLGYNGSEYGEESIQAINSLRNELYLPFAGDRGDSSAGVYYQGTNARYWSSTAYSADLAYELLFDSSGLHPQDGNYRSAGFSVRCFKNSPYSTSDLFVLVTIWDENGANKIWSGKIGSGSVLSLSGINFDKPNSYMVFDKLYTDSELTQEFDFDTPITGDLELYAGYKESETWIDWSGNPFEWDDITVCGHDYNSNTDGCITIMDRNLGATTTGAGSGAQSTSYGYYFQWGNNYGFSSDPNASLTTVNQQIDCSTYNPFNPFSSSTFIRGFSDYCISRNDNLWGGGNDNDGLVYPVENGIERQGPCPEGYHVPSKGEWYALMDMWAGSSVNGYLNSNISQFYTDFQIPFASNRNSYGGFVYEQGYNALLWSSSPYYVGNENAWDFAVGGDAASPNYASSRAAGFSVRCFKDPIFFQVTIYEGTGDGKVEIRSGNILSGQAMAQLNLNLNKPNSYIAFQGYTDPELTQEFDFDTPITGDLELYAGYKESETWIDWNGNPFEWDDITVCGHDYNSNTDGCITIMDRNLGATTTGYSTMNVYTAAGYFYQWGNNYGFPSNGSVTTSDQQIDCSNFGPSNPFSSNTFIYGYSDYCSIGNGNLWGGGSDNNRLVYPVENVSERQGPCPSGYHVPSKGEWYALLDMWAGSKVKGIISNNVQQFIRDFQIPFASIRSYPYNDGPIPTSGLPYLWSSSPNSANSEVAWSFFTNASSAYTRSIIRSYGLPIRCFKHPIYVTIYDGTGDDKVKLWKKEVELRQTIAQLNLDLSKPNSYLVFDKLYTDPELTQEFGFDTPITEDVDLYAGYTESQTWIDRNGNPFSWGEDVTICDPEDSNSCITIMDRNLGATSNDTTSSDSYGYLFQWGNNYGFNSNGNISTTSTKATRLGNYVNNGYYGNKFIISKTDPYDYWSDSVINNGNHYNLWGGRYEDISEYDNNGTWQVINSEERQGPCPEGYHVPSYGEWNKIINIIGNDASTMKNQLNIPYAGYRGSVDGAINELGGKARLWSSSPYSETSPLSSFVRLDNGILIGGIRRANAASVRCFKNIKYQIIFIDEDGTELDTQTIVYGILPIYNNGVNPLKSGYIFKGWTPKLTVATEDATYKAVFKYLYLSELSNIETQYDTTLTTSGFDNIDMEEIEIVSNTESVETGNNDKIIMKETINNLEESGDGNENALEEKITEELVEEGKNADFQGLVDIKFIKVSTDGTQEEITNPVKFSRPMAVRIPVKDSRRVKIRVKHNGFMEYGLTGLTLNQNADCENLGLDAYDGDFVTPTNGYAVIFTCEASSFVAYSEDTISSSDVNNQWLRNGGGIRLKKDNCPDGDFSDSYYDGTCEANESTEDFSEGQGNNELQTAYEFAYENKITTMDTIEKADMEGSLTRIAMAKMLSKYAINLLGKKPANKVVPEFSDITEELNAEYDGGVTLAYQLGIMGINMPDNKFRPFDLVTRAEFVTALSRLLYNTPDGKEKYYSTHMELLSKLGIITVTDPYMRELRGYVMLMLMRSAK